METDRYGTPVLGDNEHGYWWGTEHLPVAIEDYNADGWIRTRKRRYYLSGYWFGGKVFEAYVRASSDDRVETFFRNMGVKDVTVRLGFP